MVKDRVVIVSKESDICESVGVAEVEYMQLRKGRYRMYFMRIENEQRIMYNSRLEMLGASNTFSVNNMVTQ